MELARPRLLLSVVEGHLSELDVLWERRESCIYDVDWNLADLAELESRARRHLEGFCVGRGHAVDMAREVFAGNEATAATAAAFGLIELVPDAARELVGVIAEASPEVAHGVRVALRHRPIDSVAGELRALAGAGSPLARTCAVDVLAFHRTKPVEGVRELLDEDDPELRALAIAAIGRWRTAWGAGDLARELDEAASPAERRAALETSVRVGLTETREVCLAAATRNEAPVAEAAAFLGVIGSEADLSKLAALLKAPSGAPAACAGLGALGVPASLPLLIDALRNPTSAHPAAAAFIRITGERDLGSDAPLPPPDDLPEDELDFWEERLDVDPERASAWWSENEARYREAERWQAGVDVSALDADAGAALTLEARRDQYLRRRHRDPKETPDLELEAAAARQLG